MHEISMIQPFGYIDNREKMHLLTPALLSLSLCAFALFSSTQIQNLIGIH